ncbi:MAG: Rrf2 family transcriptional regulator [Phycisphaerales bacterium]|nr:Rrf2 family transcriptional regulator [Phycisphaerales bacterium]
MLSRTSEHALKALVFIAQNAEAGPVTSSQIAEAQRIPRKYLSAVLRELVRSGVLAATPGKTGGFRLSRDAADITLFDAVGRFEMSASEPDACPFGNQMCSDRIPCAGHERWSRLRHQISDFLNDTTLEDVSAPNPAAASRRRSKKNRK